MSIQDAFNQAAAESMGFVGVQDMLDAVPLDRRLPITTERQDQINHAFAIHKGFNNVQDLVDAQGMRGKDPGFTA